MALLTKEIIDLFKKQKIVIKKPGENIKIEDLVGPGFNPTYPLSGKREGILVFGLNPAGDESEAAEERKPEFFPLNYIDSTGVVDKKLLRNRSWGYFHSIMDAFNDVCRSFEVNENVKWDWMNLDEQTLSARLHNDGWGELDVRTILSEYKKKSSANYTIYIGDLFYVHETSSNNLFKWLNIKDSDKALSSVYKQYIQDMFQQHIDELLNNNVNLKFIYINNAKASKLINNNVFGGGYESYKTYSYGSDGSKKEIPVFFGGMLSNGVTDVFARDRLIKEIQNICHI